MSSDLSLNSENDGKKQKQNEPVPSGDKDSNTVGETLLAKRERERGRSERRRQNTRAILDEEVGKDCDARIMANMTDSVTKRRTTNE